MYTFARYKGLRFYLVMCALTGSIYSASIPNTNTAVKKQEHAVGNPKANQLMFTPTNSPGGALGKKKNGTTKFSESSGGEQRDRIDPELLKDIIAARKDAVRFRIRNTSELHIDDHKNEVDPENLEQDKSNQNESITFLRTVVIFQKPFHFHIPILSEKVAAEELEKWRVEHELLNDSVETLADDTVVARSVVQGHFSSPEILPNFSNSHEQHTTRRFVVPSQENSGNRSSPTIQTHILPSPEDGNAYEEEGNDIVKRENSLSHILPSPSDRNDGLEKFKKVDDLLKQHPKLVPSINRKRNSGKEVLQDPLEDVSSLPLPLNILDQAPKISDAIKREVKTLKFSQDLVNSILGHTDDFEKYHKRIRNHAEKLGMKPHEMFHAVVQGKSVNSTANDNKTKNVHQRRREFQRFLQDTGDENEKDNLNKPYNSYMKVVNRSKRGIKNWFKKVFGKKTTTTTTSTTTPRPPPPPPFDRQMLKDLINNAKLKQQGHNVQRFDKNGDTQVDFLLPKDLRRSTYLKRQNAYQKEDLLDEEILEEYLKSEEKEEKFRNETNPGDYDSFNGREDQKWRREG